MGNKLKPIYVYAKLNNANEITDINSDIFIKNFSGWTKIDVGIGVKYAHAQNNYFDKPLMSNGKYNYKYQNGKIIFVEY